MAGEQEVGREERQEGDAPPRENSPHAKMMQRRAATLQSTATEQLTSTTNTGSYVPQPTLNNPARSSEVLALFARLIALSLQMGLHETALFIAERYSCLCPTSEEAVFYHALALVRCGQQRMALAILKNAVMISDAASSNTMGASLHGSLTGSRRNLQQPKPAYEASLRCAWLYADACVQLDKPQEGSEVLKKASVMHGGNAGRSGEPKNCHIARVCLIQDLLALVVQRPNCKYLNRLLRQL